MFNNEIMYLGNFKFIFGLVEQKDVNFFEFLVDKNIFDMVMVCSKMFFVSFRGVFLGIFLCNFYNGQVVFICVIEMEIEVLIC